MNASNPRFFHRGMAAMNSRVFRSASHGPSGYVHLPRVAGFRVKSQSELKQEHFIDFETQTVFFNYQHDRWSNRIFILEHHYEVIPKDGSDTEPLCEIDTVAKRIYVNWGHSLRQQMGDVAFLKSSVAWKLAYHTCRENVETMMDLALKLWIFNGT